MPEDIPFRSLDEYVKQWKRNRRCCESLKSANKDWQVTVAFYTALHAVNAAAAKLGKKLYDHRSRNDLVKGNEAFSSVRENYLLLYRLSRFTRYDPDPDSWLPEEYLTVQALVDGVLRPIERHMESLLSQDLKLSELKIDC